MSRGSGRGGQNPLPRRRGERDMGLRSGLRRREGDMCE